MKIIRCFSMLVPLLLSGMLSAQMAFELTDIEMTIDGTSSLHNWTSEVNEVNAEGKLELNNGELKGIEGLVVTVPVTSIKSARGDIMDTKTYNAFDSEHHPNITYTLRELRSIAKTSGSYTIEMTGELTMAGITRLIDLTVTGEALGAGAIRFQGAKAIDMTEWETAPPTAMFGTLKTGKDITVNFALTLTTDKS